MKTIPVNKLFIFGVIILLFSAFCISYAIAFHYSHVMIDGLGCYRPEDNNSGIRLKVCITYYKVREGESGGGTYYYGYSESNIININLPQTGNSKIVYGKPEIQYPVEVTRSKESIILFGQQLKPGENIIRKYYFQTINPWEQYTEYVVIQNMGPDNEYPNILVIEGNIAESWRISPIGWFITTIGILSTLIGIIIKKKT